MNPWFIIEIGAFSWAPSISAVAALGLLLPVVGLSMERAWRRLSPGPGALRAAVAVLNILAFLAIAALLAPPRWSGSAASQVTLFTQGAEHRVANGAEVIAGRAYALGDEAISALSDVQPVRTLGQLRLREPALGTLRVIGDGLGAEQWTTLPPFIKISWEPPMTPVAGPVAVRWSSVLDSGEALLVSGRLRLGDDAIAELRLLDPAGDTVTTATVAAAEDFVLEVTPKAPGALIYRLQTLLGNQVLSDEPVAVYVRRETGAQLLVLQSAPSFETRQLANWAADRGSRLLIQSRISRDRDLIQGVNLLDAQALEFSADFLAATDLAVLDGRRWANLDEAERQRLVQAVRSGLGLLLLADEELAAWLDRPARWNLLGLRLSSVPPQEPRWPRWRGAAPTRPLPVVPWRIDSEGAQILTVDEAGQTLESWKPLGRGRVAVSRLRERHRWATSGDPSTFTRYWARLLREVGRPAPAQWFAPAADQRLRPGQRTRVCAQSDGDLALQFFALDENSAKDDATSRLQPHTSGAPLQCGYVWPATSGWHRLSLAAQDGASVDEIMLYVQEEGAWKADHIARRQAATRDQVELSQSAGTTAPTQRIAQPLSPWWAWGLLLTALGPLWLERRLQALR